MYVEGNGAGVIANYLNSLGFKTKFNNKFTPSSVLFILKNPIYIGKVTWKKKEIKKSKDPNKVKDTRTRDVSEWIVADGKHEPIIDIETFNKAQEIMKGKYHIPYQIINGPANPLAGIIICAKCGSKMVMRNSRGIKRILCTEKCGNTSTRFDFLEDKLLEQLDEYLIRYNEESKLSTNETNIQIYEQHLKRLHDELERLNKQKMNIFDLLEDGTYDKDTFLQRSNYINNKINDIMIAIEQLQQSIEKEKSIDKQINSINLKKILERYKLTNNIQKKNELMKSILYKVEYSKEPHQKGKDFDLVIYPKLMR